MNQKIGIGVTTQDPEKYLTYFPKYDGLILFNTDHKGIAQDKNKLIKQLYSLGCDHIFLYDSDCFPIKEGWAEWVISQNVDHAVLGDQTPGCMIYLSRNALDKVGYMNTAYGKYGWEHLGLYDRIERSGLPISQLDGWKEYFYSYDLQGQAHGFSKTEWQTNEEKEKRSNENQPIFMKEIKSEQLYYPYETPKPPKKERTGKLRMLYMYPYDYDPTFYYRLAPLRYISSTDIEVTHGTYGGQITWATMFQYDVLILERPSSQIDLQIIKLAKQVGLKIITDWDDDIFSVDNYNPMYRDYQLSKNLMMEALCLSDEVWVATEGIKKSFGLFNKNIQVIPNSHNDQLQPVSKKKPFNKTSKKILWRGGHSHEADVYENSEKWVELMKKYKKWDWYWVGCRFIWMEQRSGMNYYPVSTMPLMQYFDFMAQQNPNIVIHPLVGSKFNQSKSNISWLEASYVGAAFFGNKNMPEFEKEFIGNLDDLFGTADLEKMNKDSWEYILENLLLSKVNQQRITRLLEI